MKRLDDDLNRSKLEESRKLHHSDNCTGVPSIDGGEPGIDDNTPSYLMRITYSRLSHNALCYNWL